MATIETIEPGTRVVITGCSDKAGPFAEQHVGLTCEVVEVDAKHRLIRLKPLQDRPTVERRNEFYWGARYLSSLPTDMTPETIEEWISQP